MQLKSLELGKKVIITLFTSNCTGCEENKRIQLLKDVASNINPEKTQIIFLFGKGNNPKAIRQFSFVNSWDELPITVGI